MSPCALCGQPLSADRPGAHRCAEVQGQLFSGLYPELLARQSELFPEFDGSPMMKARRVPDLPGQTITFED